ncbi:molybdopterin-guanine dinucleotide biosynthesis protein B [Acetobacter sp.]|jgi:molybdopterin-guanine dinucleotide biosynthesis protein B|uniref:molybdopterin-guanine dinucleotide biosynthesis protein B n=1 Tax=Acetobacter sp. TaxID=440 RepID=UPI0025B7D98B|nr:molybdopterin-guanine dinucleotide biosynthesis protein B [Acetobacter sp.]MCH4092338.1 molybdopterin-guanine dinucleotide biosynthesis protein B [Acetobacter sp.]MCI1300986.1 molybdopterin-guanine dinucleotide biosynthesis protein B [Acetobacter sp.]MCI1317242.1 molybdopterin-guanine dinucleotide biosynthesis protein B [Acetobacter sp.]
MQFRRTQSVFGIIGRSGSGKTTLITRLLPVFRQAGLRVSTIKHTHHGVDMDQPGKDTFLHRENGAHEVMLATPGRWVLQHETPEVPALETLVQAMCPVDLILVEGFHATVPACLEVWRPEIGKAPLFPDTLSVTLVATDSTSLPECRSGLEFIQLDDIAGIAAFITAHAATITPE